MKIVLSQAEIISAVLFWAEVKFPNYSMVVKREWNITDEIDVVLTPKPSDPTED